MSLLDKFRRKSWERKFLIKDGHPCAVLRPRDPELALKLVEDAQSKDDATEQQKAFNEVLNAQPYQFRGYLSGGKEGRLHFYVIDAGGKYVEELQRGDSFVEAQFESFGKLSLPGWVKGQGVS